MSDENEPKSCNYCIFLKKCPPSKKCLPHKPSKISKKCPGRLVEEIRYGDKWDHFDYFYYIKEGMTAIGQLEEDFAIEKGI